MKRLIILPLILIIAFWFTGCKQAADSGTNSVSGTLTLTSTGDGGDTGNGSTAVTLNAKVSGSVDSNTVSSSSSGFITTYALSKLLRWWRLC